MHYAWLTRPRSQRSRSDEELGAKVRSSFLASDRTYGARRIWHDMLAEGVSCGLHRIERLMRLQALKARPRRRRLPPDLGERQAVACGDDGIALFEHIRYRRFDSSVFMYAFDLIELNGDDLRREPLEWRKAGSGVQLNEHLEAEGPLVFEHACRMGLEGIVSMQDPARSRARASTIKGKRGQIVPGTAVELHPLAILARLSTI